MSTIGAVVVVVLALLALLAGRRQLADLRELPFVATGSDASADVSVVIPARNEALSLPVLLASLRESVTAVREVLVVDDASTDGTAQVAASGGATVLAAPAPPPGWTGKAWACQVGADAAGGRLLLFLDADTWLAPGALSSLLAMHGAHGGLVSVQPYHRVVRPYEQLSCYFNVVSLMGSGEFARRPARHPMAYGPCLLTSRADYELAGGHAVVRAEILDDAQLAVAYDRAGLPVRCRIGGAQVRMRMYPAGPRQLVEGWTKNIASGAGHADRTGALVTALWVAAHFAVGVGAVQATVGVLAGGSAWDLGPWGVGWLAVSLQLRLLLRRVGSFRWWTWVLFPVPLVGFAVVFAWSTLLTHGRGSVRWRGRRVAVPDERRPLEDA